MRPIPLTHTFVLILLPSLPALAVPYTITDLGSLGGGSQGLAINASGQVAGSSQLASGGSHAFLYSNGVMTDINPSGAIGSFARAINSSGQVAGMAFIPSGSSYAFLYSAGTTTNLNNIAGWGNQQVQISGLNDAGQMVGEGLTYPFVYANGNTQYLSTSEAGDGSAINNAGQIAGSTPLLGHAFLYSNGTLQDLGLLDPNPINGGFSQAAAINNAGQVMGISSVHGGGNAHIFLYSNNNMIDLGAPPDAPSNSVIMPTGINDGDQIIGWWQDTSRPHAFLYENGAYAELDSLVDPSAGWTFDVAYGINDNGQITGGGTNAQGQDRAFLLTPALPGDANLDGRIDLSDLSTVLNNMGQPTSAWADGNFDNAPTIDLTDLSDILNNFGLTNSNPVTPALQSTPEPASLFVLVPTALVLLLRRTTILPRNL